MSNSVHWLYGVAGSEISHNFSYDLARDIIEAFGGEDVFLEATDTFFPDNEPDEVLTKRDVYFATNLTNDEAIVDLFTKHKADIYRSIEMGAHEYGDEAVTGGVEVWFGIDESTCEKIPAIIENDTLEEYPELLMAVTRYVCMEFVRQVSVFLEYGRI
ncbi:hypothetical protein [Psychrobacter sp. AOP31-A1-22]|uniref:hypothetical protein n=1 Tax=Psychrobacter sp. AOP31-A1-22 TaxID=3457696 RepID=UPI0040359D95